MITGEGKWGLLLMFVVSGRDYSFLGNSILMSGLFGDQKVIQLWGEFYNIVGRP